MSIRDEIIRLAQQRPFQPFGVHLSNGVVHEIRHPELVMVSLNFLYIGVPAGAPPAINEAFIESALHVVQLEELSRTSSASG